MNIKREGSALGLGASSATSTRREEGAILKERRIVQGGAGQKICIETEEKDRNLRSRAVSDIKILYSTTGSIRNCNFLKVRDRLCLSIMIWIWV